MKPKRTSYQVLIKGTMINESDLLKILNDNKGKTGIELISGSTYSDGSESFEIRITIKK